MIRRGKVGHIRSVAESLWDPYTLILLSLRQADADLHVACAIRQFDMKKEKKIFYAT